MAGFELPAPAGNFQSPIGLMRYAEEVQSHLERHEYHLGREELDTLSAEMTGLTPTFDESAVLSGIYKRYAKAISGELTEAETYLEEGILGGASYGFRILPIEDFEPDPFSSHDYESEATLYKRLRQRAVGDYVICHVLNYEVSTHASEDRGLIDVQQFQALGPIMSADLRIFGENDEYIRQTSLDESTLVLSSLKRPSRRALKKIIEELDSEVDPLLALVTCAPEIRRIIANNNQAVVTALTVFIGQIAGKADIAEPYIFNEIPPVFKFDTITQKLNVTEIQLFDFPIYIEALTTNFRYFHNRRTDSIVWSKRPEQDLYLDVAQVVHPTQIHRYSIPLSLISPNSFVRMSSLLNSSSNEV